MICLSCRRRVDPNRSFCTSCGSSVFIEPGKDAAKFLARYADPVDVTDVPPARQTARPQPRPQKQSRQTPRRDPRSGAATATAAGASAIAGLIRLAVFAAIVYYGGSALLRIPEVAAIKNALVRGDSNELESAIQALRQRFDSSASPSETTPAPEAERPALSPATPLPATATSEEPRPNPQVYLPGDGVSMPSPTVRVNPNYTPDALRRKVQGSVLLKCVVMPDFTVSDISIIKSLDPGLDEEAIKALNQWRFRPGRKDGRFVPVAVTIEMKFSLP